MTRTIRATLVAIVAALCVTQFAYAANGFFFQMTDIHLDPLYVSGSTQTQMCHRGTGDAGYYGNRWNCDAPSSLVNALPKFRVGSQPPDFIVWTGDNARHDADPIIPRTAADIYSANQQVANILQTMGVPLVPSIGNNDVYPHDTLCLGPNDPNIGNLSKIWSPIIPSDQMPNFKQFGSYTKKISPTLRVISVNSLSMFKRNLCNSGCGHGENGDLVIKWIHSELEAARQDGATVYLSGHVPPVESFWHDKCLNKYTDLAAAYQDIIAGHLYAHTHQDNYAFLRDSSTGAAVAVVNIAPSGVSTYNPSIRQYTYNVGTGKISDYTQYWANLTSINRPPHNLIWEREYTWRNAYGYNDWTLYNWIDLDKRIAASADVRNLYTTYRYVSSGLTQYVACTPVAAEKGLCVLHLDGHY